MISREKKSLALGLALGLALAFAGGVAVRRFGRGASVHAAAAAVAPAEPAPAAAHIETITVAARELGGSFETVGQAVEPETHLAVIPSRVAGRIDKLLVNFTGENVRRGQVVAEIYSPELASAVEEYRLALDSRTRMAQALPAASSSADDVVASSRRRLELLGLTPAQLQDLPTARPISVDLPIYATASGLVTERKVAQGQYVNAGDPLFTVADLSSIWIKADVYESDLPRVRLGQNVLITADALPGSTLRGRVSFIDVSVKQETRTAAVRVDVANPGLRLRPGMFVRARFESARKEVLAIPRSAVVDAGERQLVYVAAADGQYNPREVKLGAADGDFYAVLAGLSAGERVVAQGAFLLDSQTRLSDGMSGMFGGAKKFAPGDKTAPAYQLKVTFQPDPPRAGKNAVVVTLADPAGKPLPEAKVKLALVMPAMPSMNMPEMRAGADLAWNAARGTYAGEIAVPMAGPYNVVAQALLGGQAVAETHAHVNVTQ